MRYLTLSEVLELYRRSAVDFLQSELYTEFTNFRGIPHSMAQFAASRATSPSLHSTLVCLN